MHCYKSVVLLAFCLLYTTGVSALYTLVCKTINCKEQMVFQTGISCLGLCRKHYTPGEILSAVSSQSQIDLPEHPAVQRSQAFKSFTRRHENPVCSTYSNFQAAERFCVGWPKGVVESINALSPESILGIYDSLRASHNLPEATPELLARAHQMAVTHYLQVERSLVVTGDENQVDQAVRLWLMVKLWMLILHRKSTDESEILTPEIRALAEAALAHSDSGYPPVDLDQLLLVFSNPARMEAQQNPHIPNQLSAMGNLPIVAQEIVEKIFDKFPIAPGETRHFLITGSRYIEYHLFIVAPLHNEGQLQLITPFGHNIVLNRDMQRSDLIRFIDIMIENLDKIIGDALRRGTTAIGATAIGATPGMLSH